jgi:hypothetical protein
MVKLQTLCLAARTLRAMLFATSCAAVLIACGGGGGGNSESSDRGVLDESTGAVPSIVLDPPQTIGASDRIRLTWQAQGAQSLVVFIQRAADQPFEEMPADIRPREAQFVRGAAWQFDFPTAKVRVRACNPAHGCVDSNEQAMESVLLSSVAQLTYADPAAQLVQFGYATGLSADGNTMAVSSQASPAGSLMVFHRGSDRQWQRAAQLDEGTDPVESFGGVLALSGDGRTLAVLAYVPLMQGGGREGAVYVFTRVAQDQWVRQSVIRSTPPEDFQFGIRLSISHDGGRLLVGGFERTTLFQRESDRWQQAFQSNWTGPLAISPNGGTLAFGAAGDAAINDGVAAPVWVYEPCPCGSGWHRVAELRSPVPITDPSGFVFDGFGTLGSLAFSGDGKMLTIGAPWDPESNLYSAIHLFAAGEGGWTRRATLRAPEHGEFLGDTVAVSADGRVIAAGTRGLAANTPGLRRNHRAGDEPATATEGTAAIYFFEPDARGQWQRTAATVLATYPLDGLSSSISLSADGNVYAAGLLPRGSDPIEIERVVVY